MDASPSGWPAGTARSRTLPAGPMPAASSRKRRIPSRGSRADRSTVSVLEENPEEEAGGPRETRVPAKRAGGVAVRPRGPDRQEPSGARAAGSAARPEELALLLDGGRRGGGRDRPEPGHDLPPEGRRPSCQRGGRTPAGLGPTVEPRRRAQAEAVERPIHRRSDGFGSRNRSRMPRLRSAERILIPEKSKQNATS